MRSVFEPIGHLISRHPVTVAAGFLVLLMVALYGATMVTMYTGSSAYMDKSTEAGILFDTYTRTFDSNTVVLLVESSDVLSPDIIRYMDQVETALRQQQYIGQVTSVADLMRQNAEAARWAKDHMKKPVVGFIAGVTAPPGKRMGHAGALISGGADTADAKLAVMEECGFKVTRNPSEMARLLKAML